jgi:hypothetical protein
MANKAWLLFLFFGFLLTTTSCNDGNNGELGSGIGKSCRGQFAGFWGGIQRGSVCLCEGELRGEFRLNLSPGLPVNDCPIIIRIGKTLFGVEKKDETTAYIFNLEKNPGECGSYAPFGPPIGEIENITVGPSSLEFMIRLGDTAPERVVCPACFSGPMPQRCDIESEIDKPKCIDTNDLEITGSICPADSIVRACKPFICRGELFNEETGESFSMEGFPFPSDGLAVGCNTIVDSIPLPVPPEDSFTFTNIEGIPPSGTLAGPIPRDGAGNGNFECLFEEESF